MSVVDLSIVVNDTHFLDANIAVGDSLSREGFFIVFGIICGIVAVALLAVFICAVVVLRRSARKSPLNTCKNHAACVVTSEDGNAVLCQHTHTDNCAASLSGPRAADCSDEYNRMINVRMQHNKHKQHNRAD